MNNNIIHNGASSIGFEKMILLSILLHLVIIAFIIAAPALYIKRISYPQIYSVSLISSPYDKPLGLGERKLTKKVEKTEPIKKTIPKPTKKITKEVPVVSLNKKVIKNKDRELNKKIEDAINRIKSENKESDDKIEEAINRIKKESSEQGNSTAKTYAPHGEGGVIVSGIADLRYKIYYTIIWGRIKEGWILPESLIKNKKDLEAIVSFKILRNGEIMDISFEKSSGNSYFDKSALRAVEKANPLPSLPADHKEVYLEIGVRFHSSEL